VQDRLIKSLCELVQIDGESGEEKKFLRFLGEKLTRELEAKIQFDAYGNLAAKIPALSCTTREPLVFTMHGYTVKPETGDQADRKGRCHLFQWRHHPRGGL